MLIFRIQIINNFLITLAGAPFWCASENYPIADPSCDCLKRFYEAGNPLELSCDLCANETAIAHWYRQASDSDEMIPVTSQSLDVG